MKDSKYLLVTVFMEQYRPFLVLFWQLLRMGIMLLTYVVTSACCHIGIVPCNCSDGLHGFHRITLKAILILPALQRLFASAHSTVLSATSSSLSSELLVI